MSLLVVLLPSALVLLIAYRLYGSLLARLFQLDPNAVTPAVIATDILQQMQQSHIDYMLSKIPMGRFGKKEEAAALVAWLCSEDCSFTTAAVFDLSGGRATY